MEIHKHMPKNEYVQIDDEQSVFDIMDRMRQPLKRILNLMGF